MKNFTSSLLRNWRRGIKTPAFFLVLAVLACGPAQGQQIGVGIAPVLTGNQRGDAAGGGVPDTGDLLLADGDILTAGGDFLVQGGLMDIDAPLSWRPPALVNPTIVTVAEDPADATKNKITYSRYPYTAPTSTTTSKSHTSPLTIDLTASEDAEIYFPCDEILEVNGLTVKDGHNVVIRGGHLKQVVPASSSIRAMLRVTCNGRTFYGEGLLLDADNQNGVDGYIHEATNQCTGVRGNHTFQNSVIKNTALKTEPYHADGVQTSYGPFKISRFDKVTIRAGATGMFVDPQDPQHAVDLRRIDMDYTYPSAWDDPRGTTSQLFYQHANAPDDLSLRLRPPFGYQHVYVGRRDTFYGIASDGYWGSFSLNPGQGAAYGFDLDQPDPNSTYATINASFPEITGRVTRGAPAQPFVDEDEVGLNYVPPYEE